MRTEKRVIRLLHSAASPAHLIGSRNRICFRLSAIFIWRCLCWHSTASVDPVHFKSARFLTDYTLAFSIPSMSPA